MGGAASKVQSTDTSSSSDVARDFWRKRRKGCEKALRRCNNELVLEIIDLVQKNDQTLAECGVRVSLLRTKSGKEKVAVAQARTQTVYFPISAPRWHCFLPLSPFVRPDDILFFELFCLEECLASSEIRVKALMDIEAPEQIKLNNKCSLRVRKVNYFHSRKRIYFLRHGESQWNAAQREKDIVRMFSTRDHPLTKNGIHQALCIRENLLNFCSDAEAIFTSPLTRAIQTTLIALDGHKCNKMKLLSLCKENQMSFLSLDSKGSAERENIRERAVSLLKQESPDPFVEDFSMEVDQFDSEHRWWTFKKETKERVLARLGLFCNSLQFCDEKAIVVVGHSLFFKTFFQTVEAAAAADAKTHEMLSNLRRSKLPNCGCVAIDLQFNNRFSFSRSDTSLLRMFPNDSQFQQSEEESIHNSQSPRFVNPVEILGLQTLEQKCGLD